ncbi:MAG: PIN domain-containing protein [Verrucomicrobiota bacterium]
MVTRLLDTDVCIRFLRGDAATLARIREHLPESYRISVVTWYELWVGIEKSATSLLREKKKNRLELLRLYVSTAVFSEPEAVESAAIRAELELGGRVIGPYDLLIAGTARLRGWTLVTGNIGEFGRVENLECDDWGA